MDSAAVSADRFAETTDFKGPMYADPSRGLYNTFGLVQNLDMTPAGEEKRSYLGRSYIGNVLKSIWVRLYLACSITFEPG